MPRLGQSLGINKELKRIAYASGGARPFLRVELVPSV